MEKTFVGKDKKGIYIYIYFFLTIFRRKKKKLKYTTLLPVMDGGLWDTAEAPLIATAICQQELCAQIRPH